MSAAMDLQAVPTPLLALSLASADAEGAERIRAELERRRAVMANPAEPLAPRH